MKVAVAGATGRTGSESVAELRDRDHDVLALSRDPTGGQRDIGDLATVLTETDPDALIDFTVPEATVEHAAVAAETAVPLVVGTTGFDDDGLAALADAAREIPVLRASNFAKGVHALRDIVQAGVEALPEYDIELTETHHNGKRDAPSGTAKSILEDVESVRDDLDRRVHGREGDAPREAGEIGIHARRAGDVTGEHEVLVAGNRETLELTHRAGDRGVFAEGALDAAAWLAGRDPGWYGFDDVLDAGSE